MRMKIKIDYYIWPNGDKTKTPVLLHHTLNDDDIYLLMGKMFEQGDLGCPMYINKEKALVEFNIDKVIV